MSWNTKVASATDYALSSPVWYARRTVIADSAALLVEGTKYNFHSLSTQFEKGDKLMVIAFGEDGKLAVEGVVVTIEDREMFEYTLDGALPAGKLLVIKMFQSASADALPQPNQGEYLIPVTREMVIKGTEEATALRPLGIVSPGWYRWSQVTNEEGKVVHTTAHLTVSMKNFSSEDAVYDGQFAAQGMKFEPMMFTADGGIKLV